MRGNPDNLRQAATRKSAAAAFRAEQGLREMSAAVSRSPSAALPRPTAGVSLDFLYRNPELRHRVEQLRAQQQTRPAAASERVDPDQPRIALGESGSAE